MSEFEGQVVLVTGAGRGLGRAIALAFAGRGAKVAVNDIAPDAAQRMAQTARRLGAASETYVSDVAKKMQVQSMIESVRDSFERIDVLVNNAAVQPQESLLYLDEWDWDRTLAVNLKGPFLTLQSVGRVMVQQGGGVVVNLGSMPGPDQRPQGRPAYMASKTGLIGLTREAARELAPHNIRVNAVCPGPRKSGTAAALPPEGPGTDGSPESEADDELVTAEDVAQVVLFLCSDAARSIRGQSIVVGGGLAVP